MFKKCAGFHRLGQPMLPSSRLLCFFHCSVCVLPVSPRIPTRLARSKTQKSEPFGVDGSQCSFNKNLVRKRNMTSS